MSFRYLFFSFILIICCVSSASAKDNSSWLKAEAGNIEYVGDCSKKVFRTVHEDLSNLKQAVRLIFPSFEIDEEHPLLVLVLKSGTLEELGPLTKDGEPSKVAGLLAPNPLQDIMAVNRSWERKERTETVYHEYTHHLLRNYHHLPVWAHEGLAVLFSSIEINDFNLEIGKELPNYMYHLNEVGLMPFEEMMAIRGMRDYDHSRSKTTNFYAQAYAFTHFCLFSEGHPYRDDFLGYLSDPKAVTAGEPGFKKYFKMDFDSFEAILAEHVRKRSLGITKYEVLSTKRDKFEAPPSLKFRKMSEREVSIKKVTALSRFSRSLKAREIFDQIDTSGLEAYDYAVAEAFVSLALREYSDAEAALKKAVDLGDTRPSTRLMQAICRFETIHPTPEKKSDILEFEITFSTRVEISHEDMNYMLGLLYPLLQEMPNELIIFQQLAFLWAHYEDLDPAHLNLIVKGWNRFPYDRMISENLSNILERIGDKDSARKIMDTYSKLSR